ncbi:MAG: AI-2E family transporter [Patescibacteria group bacterium]
MEIKVGNKQLFFYFVAALIAYLSYLVLRSYFSAIILAFLATLIFKPVYNFILKIVSQKQKIAALLSVIFVFLVILIPVTFIGGLTVKQIAQFKNDFAETGHTSALEQAVSRINTFTDYLPGNQDPLTVEKAQEHIRRGAQAIGSFFLERLPDIGTGAFNSLTWVILFLILLYTLFPIHGKLLKFFEDISPLNDRIDTVYATRVVEMSKSMVKGTLLVALVQGSVAGAFLAIAGVPYVLFWTLLMIFLGVIPVIGYGFVLIPIALVLIIGGGIWQGVMLILASLLIIGNIDNYLRPKLVSKQAQLHPALVIIGVLGGLQVFGVLGIIYGPVIMILMVTTVEMYQKYIRPQ